MCKTPKAEWVRARKNGKNPQITPITQKEEQSQDTIYPERRRSAVFSSVQSAESVDSSR
jgi:hypothetical protein